MVPIERSMAWDEAHDFCKRLAARFIMRDSSRYTISAALSARQDRLFVDYLRNGRGTTAIGAYSPRARPGFPVAAPVSWADVEHGVRPDAFSIQRLPRT